MSEQQPECPAEFAWMKPGAFADYREYQIVQIMELPAIEQGEWRVRCQYTTETYGYLPCADLEMYGGDSEFNHVCARLAEAEARASAGAAKLARVKALLDGVGPVAGELRRDDIFKDSRWEFRESLGSCMILDIGPCMVVDNKKTVIAMYLSNYMAAEIVSNYNNLPALLSAISEVREVLKGE